MNQSRVISRYAFVFSSKEIYLVCRQLGVKTLRWALARKQSASLIISSYKPMGMLISRLKLSFQYGGILCQINLASHLSFPKYRLPAVIRIANVA